MESLHRRRLVRRIVLYATATLIVAVLAYLGYGYVPPPGLDTRMEAVFQACREDDVDRARALIAELHEDFPDSVRVVLLEGWLEERLDRLAEAQRHYRRAAELAPLPEQKRDVLLSVADLDRRLGRVEQAEALLANVTTSYGESSRGRQLRALILMDQGRLQEALNEARSLAEDDSGNPHARRLCRELSALMGSTDSPAPASGPSGDAIRR